MRLGYIKSARGEQWKTYLGDHQEVLKKFAGLLDIGNYDDKDAITVIANNMVALYRALSDKVHVAVSRADRIEWRERDLGKAWSSVMEYMCEDLKITYRILDENDDHECAVCTV
jgi:hypothetical protein